MGDVTTHFSNPGTDSSPAKTTGRKFASLLHFADVNPLTPQFKDLEDGNEVPFMPLENVWAFGKADQSARKRWKKSDTSYTQFQDGDVLVPKVTPTVFHGRSMIADIDSEIGLATSEVHVLRCKQGVDPRWIVYNMLSGRFLDEARGNVFGVGGLQRISAQYLQSYKILAIPLEAQRRIADYLDRETSEIDALVGELDGYIELLEKRKKTYIKELVSRLPNRMIQLNMLGAMKTGTTPKVIQFDPEGKQWIKPDGLSIESTGVRIGQDCISTTNLFPAGTTYICGIGATVGKVGYSSEEATCNQQITGIIPNSLVKPKMLFYLVGGITDLLRSTAPRSTLPILNNVRMGAYKLRVPLLEWQDEIIKKIDKEQNRLNLLIHECRELQSILVKRRQILITDVITGSKEV